MSAASSEIRPDIGNQRLQKFAVTHNSSSDVGWRSSAAPSGDGQTAGQNPTTM
jgi:hypothetical protein